MSEQFKLDQPSNLSKSKAGIDGQKNKRPNIDHLLKKISIERKEEKKNNLLMVVVGVVAISVVSFVIV